MVRLKDIKFIKLYKIKKYISIPYGAIKSFSVNPLKEIKILFQFLMVRLKGWNVGCVYLFSKISIPYGAIKRVIKV